MEPADRTRVTEIVAALGGDGSDRGASAEELMPLVYEELRRLARGFMAGERQGHTMQPTALVHEAYLRLVDSTRVGWQGRSHFMAVGARVMRHLLVDHARGRGRRKRGGDRRRVTLYDWRARTPDKGLDPTQLVSLDEALGRLAGQHPREAGVVELRFFGGLSMREIAVVLGISERTAAADWAHARAWLRRELARE